MYFKLAATPNLLFGANKIKQLPKLISDYGSKVLIVTGKSSFIKTFTAIDLFQDLDILDIEVELVHVNGEPSPAFIDQTVSKFKVWNPSVVVAIGGGSVLDAGKAISAMLCEEGSIANFLEGIGTQKPSGQKVPFIAIPTTSGTGSEATKNAVITQQGEGGFKKSLRHDNYIPNLALMDPSLTLTCSPSVTAACGMDAFTQLLEAYISSQSNPITDALAFDGMEKLIQSLEKAVKNGDDLEARTNMSYAAMISGIVLANAGLGVVHGFAQPLGSIFAVPHGTVCGTLMGAVNRVTVKRLREQNCTEVLAKYEKLARLVSNEEDQIDAIDALLDFMDLLTLQFKLPKFSEFGITENDIPTILALTDQKSHPIQLNDEDLRWILKERM